MNVPGCCDKMRISCGIGFEIGIGIVQGAERTMNDHVSGFEFEYRRRSDRQFFEVFHAHSQMEFTYVHEGQGNLIIEGRHYPITPHTLMIFQPFRLHRVQIDVAPDAPFVRTVILFEPSILKSYWSAFPLLESFHRRLLARPGDGRPLYEIPEPEPPIALLKPFRDALAAGLSPQERREETHAFLLHFLRQLKPLWQKPAGSASVAEPPASRHDHRSEEIMQWIESHYQEPFKLEHLARDLHLSAYHLAHLFKQSTGSTIFEYTRATRLRHASVLLIQTNLTIPEIGARVGIPDPSYFCKVFREHMGSTPHQYRLHVQKRK